MKIKTISILIPVYNEVNSLEEILKAVESVDLGEIKKQFILVDDGSKDGTRDLLGKMEDKPRYKIIYHGHNMGKGAALRTGMAYVEGDAVIVQDADLEYDPNDYIELLKPLQNNEADVVYGSRFSGNIERQGFKFANFWANKFLTVLTNLLYGSSISDMETCYKLFRYDVIKSFMIRSNKFDFEPEITAKLLKRKYKIVEVPIKYRGRTVEEGKKIGWKDGLMAIYTLFKYRFEE